jgi:hypothetical protein
MGTICGINVEEAEGEGRGRGRVPEGIGDGIGEGIGGLSSSITFNPAWMPEFLALYFDPEHLKRFCIIQSILASVTALNMYLFYVDEERVLEKLEIVIAQQIKEAKSLWEAMRYVGVAMNIVPGLTSFVLVSSLRFRHIATKKFRGIVAVHLLLALTGIFLEQCCWERRGAILHFRLEGSGIVNGLFYNTSYVRGLPVVLCSDSNPLDTELNWDQMSAMGCSPHFVYGGSILYYFTCISMASTFNIGARPSACFTCAGVIVCLLLLCLLTGSPSPTEWFTMMLLCAAGTQEVMKSYLMEAEQKQQFTQLKVKQLIGENTKKLLHTLIPPNVLESMPCLSSLTAGIAGSAGGFTESTRRPEVQGAAGKISRLLPEGPEGPSGGTLRPHTLVAACSPACSTACEIKKAILMFCSFDFRVTTGPQFACVTSTKVPIKSTNTDAEAIISVGDFDLMSEYLDTLGTHVC